MAYANLLIRPERGSKAYRLRCRFTVAAFPTQGWLEQAKFAAAEMFVADMDKQGYEYLDKHGVTMTGPYAPTVITNLPKRSEQARWNKTSQELIAAVKAGYRGIPRIEEYASNVPSLAEAEEWEYELAAVFVTKTLVIEYPLEHELKKELATR